MANSRIWSAVVGVAAAVAGLGGCGGGAGNSSAFVGQFCDIWKPCCASAGLRADGQQCRALYGALTPAGRYDATAGEACLEAMRAQAATPDFCTGNLPEPEVCNHVFSAGGTKAPGETCMDDDECAPSSEGSVECAFAFGASGEIRKCQVVIHGVAGSTPCEEFSGDDVIPRIYECNETDGLRCDNTSMTCVALVSVGGDCNSNPECVTGAYCDFLAGTCATRKAVGGTCTGNSIECVETAYCVDATMSCAARKATGGACTASEECVSNSCVNMMCGAGSGNFALQFVCGEP